jgi:hypothetical protein
MSTSPAARWRPTLRAAVIASAAVLFCAAAGTARAQQTSPVSPTTTEAATVQTTPLDARHTIAADSFTKSADGEWLSPEVAAPFAFDELIYSWNLRLPKGQGFRIHLRAGFGGDDKSPWLYAGYWGQVSDPATSRTKPRFDRGEVDMDWLKMTAKAVSCQFKVVDASTVTLSVLPTLTVVTTDNHPAPEVLARHAAQRTTASARLLDLPFRRQMDSAGNITPNRCQSAALATALEYFGNAVPLEQIVDHTWDPEYNYPGLWPRVVAAANEFGFDARIDRFRDWGAVRAALARNEVILCSIRMKEGECKEPPYKSMGNHIVALNGVTDDGRVVVTDSFLAKSGRGYRCQWLIEDFEKIWMKTKNGVAMVIVPPADFKPPLMPELPPFPAGRAPVTGDDH